MPPRILIADDNAMVRTALKQLLTGLANSEFIEAEDGRQAISKALELDPEIVILDLAMPGMNGLTAAREISKAHPDTPIFLCTMYWSPHMEREAKSAGIRQVVSKARVNILVAAVERLLNKENARLKSETDVAAINEPTGSLPVEPPVSPSPDNTSLSSAAGNAVSLVAPTAPGIEKSTAISEPADPQEDVRMRRSG